MHTHEHIHSFSPRALLAALVMLGVSSYAQATPVGFVSQQYTTSAYASVPGGDDGPYSDSAAGPLGMPLLTSAATADGGGNATGTGIADTLFLAASADASHASGSGFATGIATFTGGFSAPGGHLLFALSFDAQTFGDGNNLLNLILFADGIKIFEDNLNLSTNYLRDFYLPAFSQGILDLTLSSTVDTVASNGFALSSASFDLNSVPEPGTYWLALAGLGCLALGRKRNNQRHPG